MNVAIIDDIELVRIGLAEILGRSMQYNVVCQASNGLDFMAKMTHNKTQLDICLLDIQMPEMDGFATLKMIKEKYKNTRVLVLSMFEDDFNVIRMLRTGAQGYLLKNSSPEEIYTAMEHVFQKGFYHSELVDKHLMNMLNKESNPADLTERECEFLSYCCSELTYKQMAEIMHLSPRTVEGYRDNLCQKLGIKSRTGLVMFALRVGIVPYEA